MRWRRSASRTSICRPPPSGSGVRSTARKAADQQWSTRVDALARRLPAEDAASAIRVRLPPLSLEHLRKGRASGAAFKPARLIIETLQCGKLLLTAEPGLRNRCFQNSDGLVVDHDRHWERMPVLAAMGHRKPRRVSKPVGCAMDDLGDHCQRPNRPGTDTRDQQQIGKILWARIHGRGQRRMQPPEIDIARAYIEMGRHYQMRQ